MGTANRYSGYSATFVHAGGTLTLNQMMNVGVDTGSNLTEIQPSGAVDLSAVIVGTGDPIVSFGTQDLATLLGTASLSTGLALTGAATLQFQRREENSTFSSGSVHDSITAAAGFISVDSLAASQDDNNGATADCRLHVLYNGSTNPLVHNTSQALAGTPGFSSFFYLGPVYHNSSELKGITSVRVQTGLEFSRRRVSGDVWATKGVIVRRRPQFQITALKIDDLASLAMHGRALSGTLAVYFRKGTASGTRVADATTQHVKVSATSGFWKHDSVAFQENEDGTYTATITPTTTLALSTSSAIP